MRMRASVYCCVMCDSACQLRCLDSTLVAKAFFDVLSCRHLPDFAIVQTLSVSQTSSTVSHKTLVRIKGAIKAWNFLAAAHRTVLAEA